MGSSLTCAYKLLAADFNISKIKKQADLNEEVLGRQLYSVTGDKTSFRFATGTMVSVDYQVVRQSGDIMFNTSCQIVNLCSISKCEFIFFFYQSL